MQWTSITKTDCTIHSIVIYPVDRVIHLLNNWAQIFSRPGSIKSSTLNFKNKTVNWSLRQEEWRHKINTENKNKVVLTVLLETRLVLLLHVFHTWLHPDGRGTWNEYIAPAREKRHPKNQHGGWDDKFCFQGKLPRKWPKICSRFSPIFMISNFWSSGMLSDQEIYSKESKKAKCRFEL